MKNNIKERRKNMINTNKEINSKKLRLFPIDFKHIIANSLPDMKNYLKMYVNQGEGDYKLAPLGIKDDKILPILLKDTQSDFIAISSKYTVYYDGKLSLNKFANKVLNRYFKWLNYIYQQQEKGDLNTLTKFMLNSKTLLFTPDSYAIYIANNLETININRVAYQFLAKSEQVFLEQCLSNFKHYTKITTSAINLILTMINNKDITNATDIAIANKFYKFINNWDNSIKVKYDQQICYNYLLDIFGSKDKVYFPLNALLNDGLIINKPNVKIELNLLDKNDLTQFINGVIGNYASSSTLLIKNKLNDIKRNLNEAKLIALNTSTGLSIIKKAYHDLHPQNKDVKLVLDFLLAEYQK